MTELNETSQPKKYDKSGMIDVIDAYPDQCREALALGSGFHPELPPKITQVIVCGMGGSAMAGEIARRFARVPVFVNRSYTLPAFAGPTSLVVAVSYSGNTAETLSGFAAALDAGLPTIAVSSGGKLEEAARAREVPHLKVPAGYQPRAAMGYLAIPLLSLLSRIGLLRIEPDWDTLLDALTAVRDRYRTGNSPAAGLAQDLHGRIPLIYGTAGNTDLVAMRWKTQINENAKQPAFWNVIPELNHNEIVGFTAAELTANLSCVFLTNAYDLAENRARIEIMAELLTGKVPTTILTADGNTELAQVWSQIYLGDYMSYHLAILNRVDPTPVELIESFKRRLAAR